MVYHGPKALEELFRYDPQLVIGILGGSAGTTRDAFQLLHDAQKYGAKVALFGRKINNAENQLAFVQFLRLIVEGVLGPVDAVKAYHAVLGRLGIAPKRPLEDDLKITDGSMSYGGKSTVTVPETAKPASATAPACGCHATPAPKIIEHACECHATPTPTPSPKRLVTMSESVPAFRVGFPTQTNGRPDFAKMDSAQRLAYHRDRLGLGR